MVIEVELDPTDSVRVLQHRIEQSIGICPMCSELVLHGRHLDPERSVGENGIADGCTVHLLGKLLGGSVDNAFEDLSILRRCVHRIHRFSPGVSGRSLLGDGDRCASLGHWSLILQGNVDRSTLSPSSVHDACRAGQVDVIESLVSHYEIDVNSRDDGGWTPLHTAMMHRQEAAIRALLVLGAENWPSIDGVHPSSFRPELWSRIHGGVSESDLCATPGTVSTGKEPGDVPTSATAALNQLHSWTCSGADTFPASELCRHLCRVVDKLGEAALQSHDTAVSAAARHCRGIGMRRSRQTTSVTTNSLLCAAVDTGVYSLCRACVELGADVNTMNDHGQAPLHIACSQGKWHCVNFLLAHGAVVDRPDQISRTPLLLACSGGYVEIARLLLLHLERSAVPTAAHLEAQDISGRTALRQACVAGHVDCVRLLLEHGDDVHRIDGYGMSFLDWTKMFKQQEVAEVLVEHGAVSANEKVRDMHDAHADETNVADADDTNVTATGAESGEAAQILARMFGTG